MLVSFTEYNDAEHAATCHVNPAEVAAVREWRYHSFRPSITEIVLQSGQKLHVWQNVEAVVKRLAEANALTIWTCGCGTVNGVNLAVCRVCNRKEGEL